MLELQERQNLSSGEMLAGISTALAELQEVSPVWLATGKKKKAMQKNKQATKSTEESWRTPRSVFSSWGLIEVEGEIYVFQ